MIRIDHITCNVCVYEFHTQNLCLCSVLEECIYEFDLQSTAAAQKLTNFSDSLISLDNDVGGFSVVLSGDSTTQPIVTSQPGTEQQFVVLDHVTIDSLVGK